MKKSLILIVLLMLVLAGCQNTPTETPEVDDGLVHLTIPADQLVAKTQEELEEKMPEQYQGVTLNEDGSATYHITDEESEKMLAEIEADYEKTVKTYVEGDDKMDSFVSVDYKGIKEDITFYVDKASFGEMDSIVIFPIFMSLEIYHLLEGDDREPINPTIQFVDEQTDEVLETRSYEEFQTERNPQTE